MAIDVSAVTVVDGATVVINPPCIAEIVGACARLLCSWCQPSPSRTSNTTWFAPSTAFGIHAGTESAPRGPRRLGIMLEIQPPEY